MKKELSIQTYYGYANKNRFYVKGRVLRNPRIEILEGQSKFRTFYNNLKRFNSDEVKGANLRVTIFDQNFELSTDQEGYFDLEGTSKKAFQSAPNKNTWVPYKVEVMGYDVFEVGKILVPAQDKQYGVISDVDDTVLQTFATSRLRLKMLYATFFLNPYRRLPMEGIQQVYQQLDRNGTSGRQNPIFYVSDSPWNIYDSILTFLRIKKFPQGPIFLRDYGVHMLKKKEEKDIHKLRTIQHIMEMYPNLSFLMLGDTASEDADFYLKFADKFPGRVKAIYIRHTKDTSNARRVAKVIENRSDVNIIMVRKSAQIIEHARAHGFI